MFGRRLRLSDRVSTVRLFSMLGGLWHLPTVPAVWICFRVSVELCPDEDATGVKLRETERALDRFVRGVQKNKRLGG